jgi:AcrR family transcriptional regulator
MIREEVARKPNIRPDEPGRERVLEGALELFGERGYHATSIAEIGERAGIAKSVLYHYFDSKAAVYEAVMEAETGALLERVDAAVPSDPEAPRLQAGIDAYLDFLAERPAAWRLFLRDPPAEPGLVEVYERLARERAAGLTALLAQPRKRRTAAWHLELVAIGIRAFAAWWYDHRDVPREAVAQAILDFAAAGAERIGTTTRRPRARSAAPASRS